MQQGCILIFLSKHKSAFVSYFLYNVYTFLICHMGREMSFFMFPGLFRDPVMRYSVVSMSSRGSRIRCFTFGGRKIKRWYFRNRPFHRWKTGIAHLQHPEKGRCCKNATLIFRLSSGRRLHLSYPLWREIQTKCIRLFKIVKLGSCQHIDSRCCFTFVNQLKVKKKMTSITPRLNRSREGRDGSYPLVIQIIRHRKKRDLYALPFLGGRV